MHTLKLDMYIHRGTSTIQHRAIQIND